MQEQRQQSARDGKARSGKAGARNIALVVGICAIAAVVLFVLLSDILARVSVWQQRSKASPLIIEEPKAPLPAQPPKPERAVPSSPYQPRMLGDRNSLLPPPIVVEPPYEPIDAASFKSSDQLIVLEGLESPALGAVCYDDMDRLWACGLQARAALYNIIRQSRIVCEAGPDSYASGRRSEMMRGSCQIEGRDLAAEIVRTGFARQAGSSLRSGTALVDAQQEARTARRGLWNGEWRFVR